VASDGRPPWEKGDPIHLSLTACRDLAAVLGDSVLAGAAGDSASDAGSGSGAHSHKRRRIEPVVTMPPPDARKPQGGSGRARVAGWLVGRADAGSGNGPRRGSGHVNAGGGSRSHGGGSLRGHRGRYGGPTPRGGWRYGGRSRW
jgi:hypothetical protein